MGWWTNKNKRKYSHRAKWQSNDEKKAPVKCQHCQTTTLTSTCSVRSLMTHWCWSRWTVQIGSSSRTGTASSGNLLVWSTQRKHSVYSSSTHFRATAPPHTHLRGVPHGEVNVAVRQRCDDAHGGLHLVSVGDETWRVVGDAHAVPFPCELNVNTGTERQVSFWKLC